MKAANTAYNKLLGHLWNVGEDGEPNQEYIDKFKAGINDDLNTPQAIGVIWDLLKSDLSDGIKKATALDCIKVLGLNVEFPHTEIPAKVEKLMMERAKARVDKNWDKADELRDKIEKVGFTVEDYVGGQKVKKAN